MSRARGRAYVSPMHHTPEELLRFKAADLYTDLRCAKRDGQPEYAAEVQAKIDTLTAAHPVEAAKGAALAAKWAAEVES